MLALAMSVVLVGNAPAAPEAPDAIPLPVPLPLKHIPVPEPPNLDEFVRDRQAAIALGKALFWDMQVGSDGKMACASCHFSAGADTRDTNTINPGPNGTFNVANPNETLTAGNFPFHQRSDPDFQNSAVTLDWDDIAGSQGVRSRQFVDIIPGQAVENTTAAPDLVFQVGGVPIRRVTGVNAPSVINAAYYYTILWDGAANNIFNGVNPHGATDLDSKIFVETAGGMQAELVRIRNAALASQAVGPVLNPNEMSAAGRTFPKVGKKMLTLRPLAQQFVAETDSVLGPFSRQGSGQRGLSTTYADLIQAAFQPKYWSNVDEIVTYQGGVPSISPRPGPDLTTDQFTQMEANFSLFFGLSVQLYEATLVSDDTPYDRALEGKLAMSPIQERGNALFAGECAVCHAGSEFTTIAHSNVAFGPGGPLPLVELMTTPDFQLAIYDDGFFNIGVTRTTDDIARGKLDPFGRPLAWSSLGHLKEAGTLDPGYAAYVPDLPPNAKPVTRMQVNGAFKAPGLRNIELTGPYFHNGGVATLNETVQFYTRGGNFPVENRMDLDPNMIEIVEMQGHPEIQAEIIAFLKMLTDERVRDERAPFDHPQLFVPIGADPANPANDLEMEIPAVGAAGRVAQGLPPLGPFVTTSAAPVVVDDVFTVPAATAALPSRNYLDVLLNDADPDGDPLTVVNVTAASGATVSIGEDGLTVVYEPPVDFTGFDTLTYIVSDGNLTTTGTVNVTVQSSTNRPPEAQLDFLPIVPADSLAAPIPVLLNDLDLDGNPLWIVSVTQPLHGVVTIDPVRDQLLYAGDPGFAGQTEFTYTITDGSLTSTARVVLKVNGWPVAVDDTFTVPENSVNNALLVLSNDTDLNRDDILTVLAVTQPLKGQLFIDPTGTYISYTPLPGAKGTDRITYFVGDATVADSATVTINIEPIIVIPNSPPTLADDAFSVLHNSTDNVFDVLANDSDPDGDAITIVSVTRAAHGSPMIDPGGHVLYTPAPGYFGTDTFAYLVQDAKGAVSTANVTVNVVLDQPYRVNIPFIDTAP